MAFKMERSLLDRSGAQFCPRLKGVDGTYVLVGCYGSPAEAQAAIKRYKEEVVG